MIFKNNRRWRFVARALDVVQCEMWSEAMLGGIGPLLPGDVSAPPHLRTPLVVSPKGKVDQGGTVNRSRSRYVQSPI